MYITPKRCARCRYERLASDTAPDWQCPACGVAYNKAEDALNLRPVGVRVVPPSRRSKRFVCFAIALIVIGGLYAVQHRQHAPAARIATAQPEVLMYATSWCGYCAKARAFFAQHGISYVEIDVERDARAEHLNRLLGGGGIPTILVGKDELVHGFDEQALSRLLGPWMR
ncbi:MAG: putative glutaredoxin.1 [Candidatus Accumulibacter phosphatis]|uniref:Putative glutaredoxin.1 n=1 Tax=Candidatus Accumulibacter phosphatis TaxID=327160 RepID=A0A080LXL1_9PROT|nr:glutaredoxin domain-containing protein [Accumulibacter sp.]KFB73612.1 MAG: putative glutaredoxin.1 [Candidatus Accumulibacter phosphatis]HRF10705.1 glutaredoxin domain-containing protein [Candidatus Accumulibacter phosphatis]